MLGSHLRLAAMSGFEPRGVTHRGWEGRRKDSRRGLEAPGKCLAQRSSGRWEELGVLTCDRVYCSLNGFLAPSVYAWFEFNCLKCQSLSKDQGTLRQK